MDIGDGSIISYIIVDADGTWDADIDKSVLGIELGI